MDPLTRKRKRAVEIRNVANSDILEFNKNASPLNVRSRYEAKFSPISHTSPIPLETPMSSTNASTPVSSNSNAMNVENTISNTSAPGSSKSNAMNVDNTITNTSTSVSSKSNVDKTKGVVLVVSGSTNTPPSKAKKVKISQTLKTCLKEYQNKKNVTMGGKRKTRRNKKRKTRRKHVKN